MTIKDVALKINELALNYRMSNFQKLRKELKNAKKLASNNIFEPKSIFEHENYAFHYGGRKEIQYNIAFEGDTEIFRYGIAFSLETSQSLPNIYFLEPKIKRFNNYLENNPETFFDSYFWYYKEGKRSNTQPARTIDQSLIKNRTFIFIGRYFKKSIEELSPEDYEKTLTYFDELLDVYKYVESGSGEIVDKKEFRFVPGNNEGKSYRNSKYQKCESQVDLIHQDMKNKIFQQLTKIYGKENVATEQSIGSDKRVDLIVKNNGSYIFYELKTSVAIRICIREALSQLLEYSYWPDDNRAEKLIITSHNPITIEAQKYLKKLREEFHLPVFYQFYDLEKNILEDRLY